MKVAITIKDIAKLAGVSPSTVSCVLNNNPKIGEKTRNNILQIIKDTGFIPNIYARGLVNSKTNMIAVVMPDVKCVLGDRYFGEGVSGIYETALKHNYKIILERASYEFTSTKRHLSLFKEHSIDGMLYIGSTINDTYLVDFVGREYPFILVNSFLENIDINYVTAENENVGYKAVECFYNAGHRKIAFIYGSMNVPNTLKHYIGYKKFLTEKKIKISAEYILPGDFSQQGGYKATLDLLECSKKPTAIFCGNDLMAIGCMKALKEKKILIPDDVAVIGCDNIKFGEFVTPKLTTFSQDIYEIASLACEKLINIIEKKSEENVQITLNSEFIIRESCGSGKNLLKGKRK
jgi:DNA-binding LacI/PurR family transcriptional regulator